MKFLLIQYVYINVNYKKSKNDEELKVIKLMNHHLYM